MSTLTARAFGLSALVSSARTASSDAGRVLLLTHLFTSLLLLAAAIAPITVGWHPHAVMSGSMLPAIEVGSTVIVAPVGADLHLATPTIVTFPDAAHPGRMVTHRVVDSVVEARQVRYVTKGDANRESDSAMVSHTSLVGAARLVVPYAGLPAVWAGRGQWLFLLLWGTALAAGTAVLIQLLRRPQPDPGHPR